MTARLPPGAIANVHKTLRDRPAKRLIKALNQGFTMARQAGFNPMNPQAADHRQQR